MVLVGPRRQPCHWHGQQFRDPVRYKRQQDDQPDSVQRFSMRVRLSARSASKLRQPALPRGAAHCRAGARSMWRSAGGPTDHHSVERGLRRAEPPRHDVHGTSDERMRSGRRGVRVRLEHVGRELGDHPRTTPGRPMPLACAYHPERHLRTRPQQPRFLLLREMRPLRLRHRRTDSRDWPR